jgi:hypothetical protein
MRIANRSLKGPVRWLLVTGLVSLLSLQVIAADHWHGVDDTQHCEICLHAHDAPVYNTPQPYELYACDSPQCHFSTPIYEAGPKYGSGNRDPPNIL